MISKKIKKETVKPSIKIYVKYVRNSTPILKTFDSKSEYETWASGFLAAANEEFSKIACNRELDLEMINVGESPGDCTGDLLDVALIKFIRNLGKILE